MSSFIKMKMKAGDLIKLSDLAFYPLFIQDSCCRRCLFLIMIRVKKKLFNFYIFLLIVVCVVWILSKNVDVLEEDINLEKMFTKDFDFVSIIR